MIVRIAILLFLIFINGILSASEIAYISLNKYELKNKRKKKLKKIYHMLEEEGKFLSTIQIGITLAGFLASAFAADTFTDLLMGYGIMIGTVETTETILMVVITLLLSYVTLVFGELVPKKIGRSNPMKVALLTIDFISFIAKFFHPLIVFLTASTNFVSKLLHIEEKEDSFTEEDIKKMIVTGNREGIVEEKEKEYILNIFDFNDKIARDIMTPKKNAVVISKEDQSADVIRKIKTSKFTRFPVLNSEESVIGFINIRDFIYFHKAENNKEMNMKNFMHPVLKFKEDENIDDIFKTMQEHRQTFSVIEKDGKFVGILTMEDAIEEIVGNISDEYN